MPYSYVTYPADGTVQIFAVTFPYIKKEHVHVYVDAVEDTGYTWMTDTTVRCSSMPPNGALVVVRRQTPYAERSVDFTNDSVLDEVTLDNAHDELFYVMQETREANDEVLTKDLASDFYDLDGARMTNAGDPVGAQDLVTKAYFEANNEAVGNLAVIEQIRDDVEDMVTDINNAMAAVVAPLIHDVTVTAPLTIDDTDPVRPVIGIDAEAVGGGGGLQWYTTTSNQTAEKNKGIMVSTESGIKTVTPMSAPNPGDTFGVADWKDTFHLNKCVVALTGLKLHGVVQTEDMVLDVKGQKVELTYSGATQGWIITSLIPFM